MRECNVVHYVAKKMGVQFVKLKKENSFQALSTGYHFRLSQFVHYIYRLIKFIQCRLMPIMILFMLKQKY